MPDLVRLALAAGVWSLVAFHAALLARRLAEPGALDATSALRWAGTALILGLAFALRASADRLTRRQLLVLALAVLALHAPVLQGAAEADRAAGFWIALPSLLAPALALWALLATFDFVREATRATAASAAPALRFASARVPFSPRPPPLL